MGHEFAGVTSDGHRVVVNPLVSCGECDLCSRGVPQLCRHRELLGVHRPGGFAEAVAVPQSALHDLAPEVGWETAAMVEPLANAVHAYKQAGPQPGQRLAVIGAGTIGLVCPLVARDNGLDVTSVDRSRTRLDVAARLGATACTTRLEGEFDVIIDAVGLAVTRSTSVELLAPGGRQYGSGLPRRTAASTAAGWSAGRSASSAPSPIPPATSPPRSRWCRGSISAGRPRSRWRIRSGSSWHSPTGPTSRSRR